MDLYKPKTVYGIMIQGRSQIQQWVTKFKVQYGHDEKHLEYIQYSRTNKKEMVSVCTITFLNYDCEIQKEIQTIF